MPLEFETTVQPINFQNLSGNEFERLVFATLLRMHAWHTLDWHGQTGGDGGRDIIGVRDNQYGHEITIVYACANWQVFTSTKGNEDIDKIVTELTVPPDEIVIITGSKVSAQTKKKCVEHATEKGVNSAQIWSGPEFEEHLRFHAASVLQRFYNGVKLPDEPGQLRSFVTELDPATERESGELVALLFKRPAFTTPIWQESSLPAFRQAIGDTIGALRTGIWRDREDAIISRFPAVHTFPTPAVRESFEKTIKSLVELRAIFDDGLKQGLVVSLGPDPDGPWFNIDHGITVRLTKTRKVVLKHLNAALKVLGVLPVR